MQVAIYLCIDYIHSFDETFVTCNYYELFSLYLYYYSCIRYPFVISVPYGLNNQQLFLNNNHAFSSSFYAFFIFCFLFGEFCYSFRFPHMSTALCGVFFFFLVRDNFVFTMTLLTELLPFLMLDSLLFTET